MSNVSLESIPSTSSILPKLSAVMGTVVVYHTFTHARHYHAMVFCEASVNNDSKFQPMAISVKHVDSASTALTASSKKASSLWVEIWKLVKPDLLLLILVAITAVGAAVVNLQTPTVTGELINVIAQSIKGAGELSMEELKKPAMKLLGLFLSQGFLTFSHISLVSTLGENVASRLKSLLFSAIVKQDISFFDSHKSGELVGRLTTDVADFKVCQKLMYAYHQPSFTLILMAASQHTFKQIVTQGLKSIAQTIGSAIHLVRISPSLTFTLLATMPVLYGILNVYGTYLRKISKQGKELDGIASGLAGELIANVRTVRAFAAEDRESERYQASTDKVAKSNTHLGLHIGLFQGMTNAAIGCMEVLIRVFHIQALIVLYYGGSLVVKNEMTGGDLMTYMLSTQSTQRSLVSLGVLFGQSIKAVGSATRVFEFVHATPNVPLHGGVTLPYLDGNIRFDNVSFHYPTRQEQQVLENFTLDIPQGTMVALCGPSGSGKSTVAALLERFYEPCDGQILIDGTPLNVMDPSWIRQQIGFINQEPVLFAASIADNIRYGNPDATDEEVRSAARKANAETFIEAFPDGYDTMVGERGASLSGGQKQRVAIARAILKNPKILILDEATSALDTHSEKLVQEALDELMKGKTVLVVAHRLSTIRSADLIVVMGREIGNVIEKGTHEQLMKKRGMYYALHNNVEAFS
ncbi:hypothetical protein INT44_006915 [Umbelopsis vinacea]|uniref:Mitochondrial potassium channel ATP-binding subunit n=1 Tax=Umbelopsis vinacea TaxID=44442 RepID=A0A8H7U7R2_9FUNG|nr:hypothetical protein INT44_006915 [Umbelopsis vinacea]